MEKIPVRHLKDSFFEDRFSIKAIEPLVINGAMIHELHRHDFYFILFIRTGMGDHEIDFIKYKVDNYSVFFIRPGQVHQLKLEQGTTGFMLQFASDFYAPRDNVSNMVLRKVSHKNHCHLSTERFERIYLQLQAIFLEFTQKQDRYKEVVKASLDIIFIELVRESNNPNNIVNKAKLYAQERLEELQYLLEKNIRTKKQVSEYAKMLSITPYQLNAITKATLEKTGSELINEHIILEAKRMLIGTGNQVNQVADMLGYDDTSYFIRFFKKQTGLTPEAFRQNFK
ncbi:helix-turn-helix domain-containing protein [Arenibacter sp. F20364]|uniref:helix-turn-helix domain-containing protein n=1 Tax=Arenibacter sp. F20364 TaxID=2926415 RepID=UPI001FF287A3|nr:helix-turn-helix domain-containing protein [Arenibacter sp. F20364]MCK0190445.1 helix-turn-helix transcriptional regulator [Arenibacter sp. F20364]